jgi:hypothetical protein
MAGLRAPGLAGGLRAGLFVSVLSSSGERLDGVEDMASRTR